MAALALTSASSRAGGSGFHNILEAKRLKIRHACANANRFSLRTPNKLQLKCHKTYLQPLYDPLTTYGYAKRSWRSKTNRMLVFACSAPEDVVVKKSWPLSSLLNRKWSPADMTTAVVVFGMHALCLLAPFTFTWKAFGVFVVLYVITGLLGITLSYHRNLSHRSFKLPKWLEYIFAYCGAQALQGDPLDWVSTHRYHHQYCDSIKDPHSPNDGFWFSHMSWMFDEKTMLNRIGERNNVSDLEKQAFYKFIRTTYIVHPIAMALSLYALGGLPFLVWGMAVRVVWVYHITWLVNSACHVWGYQSWKTGDLSRNNWWVAALAFGEGWHNNHHAFEFSAQHGLEWWQLDITWYVIKILEAVGLAKDVRLPSKQHKERMSF